MSAGKSQALSRSRLPASPGMTSRWRRRVAAALWAAQRSSVGYQEARIGAQGGVFRLADHYAHLLGRLARVDVLVLYDWGLSPLREPVRRDLLEILEDRYGTRSTVVLRTTEG